LPQINTDKKNSSSPNNDYTEAASLARSVVIHFSAQKHFHQTISGHLWDLWQLFFTQFYQSKFLPQIPTLSGQVTQINTDEKKFKPPEQRLHRGSFAVGPIRGNPFFSSKAFPSNDRWPSVGSVATSFTQFHHCKSLPQIPTLSGQVPKINTDEKKFKQPEQQLHRGSVAAALPTNVGIRGNPFPTQKHFYQTIGAICEICGNFFLPNSITANFCHRPRLCRDR
jgi:hypothetical protein